MAPVQSTLRKELTPQQRAAIWALHIKGFTPTQIHRKKGTPRLTINSIIRRQQSASDELFKGKPQSVAKHKLSL